MSIIVWNFPGTYKADGISRRQRISPSTLQKFREVFAHVERYIQNLYKSTDIPIRRVDYFFVKQFEDTLLSQGLKAITINKIMQRLRQMSYMRSSVTISNKTHLLNIGL